jgi:hypothetical protein
LVGLGVWVGVQQLKYLEFYELAATARRIWQRKRIAANNLQIRRAIESFPKSTAEFPVICGVLEEALASAGFCGISISFPQIEYVDEVSLLPLRRDGMNRYSHFWVELDQARPEWELRLELKSSSGSKLADLYLLRGRASDPFLIDVNLLGDEYRAAMSDMIARTISRVLTPEEAQEKSDPVLAMTTASGDS